MESTPIDGNANGSHSAKAEEPKAETEQDSEDPTTPLESFDWNDLVARFNKTINDCDDEEAKLMAEFHQLLEV